MVLFSLCKVQGTVSGSDSVQRRKWSVYFELWCQSVGSVRLGPSSYGFRLLVCADLRMRWETRAESECKMRNPSQQLFVIYCYFLFSRLHFVLLPLCLNERFLILKFLPWILIQHLLIRKEKKNRKLGEATCALTGARWHLEVFVSSLSAHGRLSGFSHSCNYAVIYLLLLHRKVLMFPAFWRHFRRLCLLAWRVDDQFIQPSLSVGFLECFVL